MPYGDCICEVPGCIGPCVTRAKRRPSEGSELGETPKVEELLIMRLRAYEMRQAVKEAPDGDSARHLISQITIWEACADICERLEALSERLDTSP